MTTLEIRSILSTGGNVIVDASKFTALELRTMASTAQSKGVKITIHNADSKTALECRGIAAAGGIGTVNFDFSK